MYDVTRTGSQWHRTGRERRIANKIELRFAPRSVLPSVNLWILLPRDKKRGPASEGGSKSPRRDLDDER